MEEPIETYNPTMLAGLGLFLIFCMPMIFMIAFVGDQLIPYSMGTFIVAPIVGLFTVPAGLIVMTIMIFLRRKYPEKPVKWRSAVSGSCVAMTIGSIAWFLKFSFSV